MDLAPTIESMEKPSLEEPLVLGVTEVVEFGWGSTDDDMVSVTRVMPELGLDTLRLDIIQVLVWFSIPQGKSICQGQFIYQLKIN